MEKASFTMTGFVTSMDDSETGRQQRTEETSVSPSQAQELMESYSFPTALSDRADYSRFWIIITICLGCWSHAIGYRAK